MGGGILVAMRGQFPLVSPARMSYRRLFLLLFLGCTVLLAGSWWQSTRSYTAWAIAPRALDTYFSGSLHAGTLHLQLISQIPPIKERARTTLESIDDPAVLGLMKNDKGSFGRFQSKSVLRDSGPGMVNQVRTLSMPLWFPWLLAVTGGFFLMRFMEKRSTSGKEKRLAKKHASRGSR